MAFLTYDIVSEILNKNPQATTLIIPDNITRITQDAFKYEGRESNIKEIVLPDSVNTITSRTFYGMEKIEKINIPGNVKKIGESAFSGCKNLKYISIAEGVESIEESVFYNCDSLEEIVLPSTIRNISYRVFSKCTSLKKVVLNEGLESISDSIGLNDCENFELHIPSTLVSADRLIQKANYSKITISENNPVYKIQIKNGSRIVVNTTTNTNIAYLGDENGKYTISAPADDIATDKGDVNQWDKDCDAYKHCPECFISKSFVENKKLTLCNLVFNVLVIDDGIEEIELDRVNINKLILSDSVKKVFSSEGYCYKCDIKEIVFGNSIEEISRIESITTAYPSSKSNPEEFTIELPASMKIFKPENCNSKINKLILNEGLQEISGFSRVEITELNLPSTLKRIGGFSLTKISEITFPEGLEEIYPHAFTQCPIKNLEIPSSVKKIGEVAFLQSFSRYSMKNPENLTSIILHEGIEEIEKSAFCGAIISEITLPSTLKKVAGFDGCINLKKLVLPEGLEEIGEEAFSDCLNVESISLPSTLKKIGKNGFHGNSALKKIDLPEGLEELGVNAFDGCDNLTELTIPESCKIIDNCALQCNQVKTIKLPSKVEYLGKNVFPHSPDLKELKIPEGPYTLLSEIFNSLVLDELRIPDSITKAEVYERIKDEFHGPFANCKIKKLILGTGIKSIPDGFFSCSSFEEIVLPEGIEALGQKAFRDTENLTTINIPASLRQFGNNSDLKKMITALKRVGFTNIIEAKRDEAAEQERIKKVVPLKLTPAAALKTLDAEKKVATIPEGTEVIGSRVFEDITTLEKVILPEGLKTIEKNAFRGCYNIKEMNFPSTLTTIGEGNLDDNKALEVMDLSKTTLKTYRKNYFEKVNVVPIPPSVKEIHFSENDKIISFTTEFKKIYLPKTVEEIVFDRWSWNNNSFTGKDLICFEIDKDNPFYEIKDNCLIKKETGEVIRNFNTSLKISSVELAKKEQESLKPITKIELTDVPEKFLGSRYLPSLEEINLPEGIKTIGEDAFYCAENLKHITIPSTVTSIETRAFCNCKSLEEITLPANLTNLGILCFSGCKSLKKINIPEGISVFPSGIFSYCEALEEITIPSTVTEIQGACFVNCKALKSIKIPENVEHLGIDRIETRNFHNGVFHASGLKEIVFEGNKITTLYPEIFAYCNELTSVTLPDSLKEIPDSAFENCANLIKVNYAKDITKIGQKAFTGCRKYTDFTIPETVTEIGKNAYYNTAVEEAIIPEGIKEIPDFIFGKCKSLKKIVIPSTVDSISTSAFSDAVTVETIESSSPKYPVENGILYLKNSKRALFCACGGRTEVAVPDVIKRIDSRLFFRNITSVSFGENSQLEKIDAHAALDWDLERNVIRPLSNMLSEKASAKSEKIQELTKSAITSILTVIDKGPEKKFTVNYEEYNAEISTTISDGSLVKFKLTYSKMMQWISKLTGFLMILMKEDTTSDIAEKAGNDAGFVMTIVKVK